MTARGEAQKVVFLNFMDKLAVMQLNMGYHILILASSQKGVLLAKQFLYRNMNVISLISFYKNVLGRDFNEPLLVLFCFDVSFAGNSDAQWNLLKRLRLVLMARIAPNMSYDENNLRKPPTSNLQF